MGMRWWKARYRGGRPYLTSMYLPVFWEPGVQVARCLGITSIKRFRIGWPPHHQFPTVEERNEHRAPDPECNAQSFGCGFWALTKWVGMQVHRPYSLGSEEFAIAGQIKGWGRVIIGESGWRAEKVQVHSLFRLPEVHKGKFPVPGTDEQMLRALSTRYEAPILDEAVDSPPTIFP